MKKIITYLLTMVMLISVISIAPIGASAVTIDVVKFESADDVLKWYSGNYYSNAPKVTNANVSQEHTLYSPYSLYLENMSKTHQTTVLKDIRTTVPSNAPYLCMPIYLDSTEPIMMRMQLHDAAGGNLQRPNGVTLKPGWNLLTLKVTITEFYGIGLYTYAYGCPNDGTQGQVYKDAKVYINGAFFTDTASSTPEITGASIKDGYQYVAYDIGSITLTGKYIDIPEDGFITMEPHVDLSFVKGEDSLEILFGDLEYGTSYTLSFADGVYDVFGNAFKPYTLTFRTLEENGNIPPAVTITSPEANDRYLPTDSITLTAKATDDDGTIEYVEFYLDDTLIEGSRVTSDTDEFTYVWEGAPESVDMRAVTAKAVDNGGADALSEPVKIRVLGHKNPTVEIISPESDSIFYGSVGGAEGSSTFTLTAKTADIDSTVAKAEVYVDGKLVHTATENLKEFTWKYPKSLSNGTHEIEVVATDDMDLTGSASVSVDVISVGKSFPALLENDLSIAKWAATKDTAKVESAEDGIVITTEANDAVRLVRTLRRNMSISPWQADIAVALGDNSHTVTVGLVGTKSSKDTDINLVTFKNDGTTSLGTTYEAGKTYVVSAVVDPENSKITTFVDGEIVASGTLDATFTSQARIFVSHSGAGASTVIKSAEIYTLKEACGFGSVALYKGAAEQSPDSVSRTLDYITVELEGGIDTDTLEGNVKLVDKFSGRVAATEVRDGKIYINEILKSGKVYSVVVGSGVSNAEGRGLAGNYAADFTVEKAPVDIKMSDDGSEITVVCQNSTDSAINEAVVVICVYDGSKMTQPASITPVTFGVGETIVPIAIPSAESGNIIEAFVVDSMEKLNSISDDIYIIKKEG